MNGRPSTPDGKGYLLAVLAATLVMLVVLVHNLVFALFVWPISVPVVVIATFLPAAIAAKIGRHFHVSSVFYFLACSLAVAMAGDALVGGIVANQPTLPGLPPESFTAAFLHYLPVFVAGALVGGSVYWWVTERRVGGDATGQSPPPPR